MAPLKPSDLIFSEQANHQFSKTLGDIRKHTLSIRNRLQSILEDAAFVQDVAAAYGRPVITNERCGSWYTDPRRKAGSAYFKSTDGHTGQWKFSTRRLNLHLLETIGMHDGCVIVDSTRRGKRMPDALSKTVPIWCAVVNRALFPDRPECHDLFTPPQAVAPSEHAQVSARLGDFYRSLLALGLDLPALRRLLAKPVRPVWVTPRSPLAPVRVMFEDYHPVVCCTASRRVAAAEVSESGYVQGSGDDTENWAHGLTPPVFWANSDLLLSTPESELPALIEELVARSALVACSSETSVLAPIAPTSCLYITSLAALLPQPLELRRLVISLTPNVTDPSTWQTNPRELSVGIGPHKLGSRNLRTALPAIVDFVDKSITPAPPEGGEAHRMPIFVACATGKDYSVGVALALLCVFFDDKGNFSSRLGVDVLEAKNIDKLFIRRRLGWIVTAMPDANPSRPTLQSINSYLMEKPI
jgi:tRNA A64-2'-O-ribosylphosphate transferase